MRARWWCALPTVIVGLISAASVTALSTATQVRPWEDRGLGADRRAQLLVATMTLDEKTALLYGYGAKRVGPDRWQVYVKGNDRLGIPDMTQGDSPSGILVGSDAVIQMPASIGLAATWSLDDARAYGDVMGGEARALGYGVLQGPNVDIARDPRHGRAYDTLGEGRISIPTSGTYGFDFLTPDAAKLEIDGRLVLNAETTHALTRKAARLQLSAGKQDFRVAYRLGTAKGEREPVGHSHVLKVGWLAPPGVYEPSIAAAARRAAAADIALVVVRDLESETLDRVNLTLPNDQDRLIEAVARANPRTVVALTTGSAVLMPWSSRVPAILEAWYGGTAAGAALSSVLFGDADASGRLPISFPASLADLPTALATQFPGVNGVARFTEGLRVGYRHYGAPHGPRAAYPFGFGLSYTAFAYGQLSLTRHQIPAIDVPETTSEETPAVVVNVRVSNRGERAGVAVPQVYIRFPSTATEPAAILKGFERIQLGPGKSALISLPLRTRDFAVYVPSERRWKVQPGVYRVCVGTSSTALLLCGDVTAHSAASAAR